MAYHRKDTEKYRMTPDLSRKLQQPTDYGQPVWLTMGRMRGTHYRLLQILEEAGA